MDRFDHYNSHDDSKIRKEARKEKVDAAGPLFLEPEARTMFETSIAQATKLPAGDVKKVVDKIDELSGQEGADPKAVIKEAVGAYIKKEAFVNNLARELAGTVETAMKSREARIEANELDDKKPKAGITNRPAPGQAKP